MDNEKSGWLYLIQVILFVGVMVLQKTTGLLTGISLIADLILSESLIFVPALIFAAANHENVKECFRLKKVRISSLLLSLLYVFLLYPLIAAMNALTMSFTENTMLGIGDEVTAYPFPLVFLIIAVFGPLCEELAFRGVIFSGLKRSGKILAAAILQGVMFGFMHLNVNQMAYALVLGIAFGILVETTGSIWTSFIGHMLINSIGVAALYFLNPVLDDLSKLSEGGLSGNALNTSSTMLIAAGIYGIISIGTVFLASLVLRAIASSEGRLDVMKNITRKKRPEEYASGVMSVPTVTALILAGVFMIVRLIFE